MRPARPCGAELDRLEAEYADADELPDDVDQRLDEIETALIAFEERPLIYDPADIARAGAFISIDSEGKLRIDRGYSLSHYARRMLGSTALIPKRKRRRMRCRRFSPTQKTAIRRTDRC